MANMSTNANTHQMYHRPAQISPVNLTTSSGGGHPGSMYFLNDSSASPAAAASATAAAGMTNHHYIHQQQQQHDFVDYQYIANNNSNDDYEYLAPLAPRVHPSNTNNSMQMQYLYNWNNTSHNPATTNSNAAYTTATTNTVPFVRILSPDHLNHHQCAVATEAPLHHYHLPPLENDSIVQPEDLPLITDYFRFLMSQFESCKFQELDRTARGGKRESIEIGFAGLQCRHCNGNHSDGETNHKSSGKTNTRAVRGRKFFWGNVDRLANSISEFSSHLTRCRACPPEIKIMLGELKEVHPMQAAKVSKGSQKAFLRRVWTRIHHGSTGVDGTRTLCSQENADGQMCENDDVDDEYDAMNGVDVGHPQIIPRNDHQHRLLLSKVMLMDNNNNTCGALDRLLHENIEVFEANDQDVQESEMTRNPVLLGQVGLRCIHCAVIRTPSTSSSTERNSSIVNNNNSSAQLRSSSSFAKKRKAEFTTTQIQNTVYPLSNSDIFDAVEDLRCHFECCPCIPTKVFGKLIRASKSSISALCPERQFMYDNMGKKLKIMECVEGIRYHGDRDL
eukprot:CAMPEP_0116049364 /NCGR_PEP_ID=MMETSP0321-20121206/30124_1 /TAXON_ID=163516 /ORGANISM="Leptocylindrus danicus var. danicus, Strain B650" /LENGTH=560 /DNA_ID=CAMNT_0003531783 /DNA_START=161 /DNA_END=1843 /DNA_ORIENTATION=+